MRTISSIRYDEWLSFMNDNRNIDELVAVANEYKMNALAFDFLYEVTN